MRIAGSNILILAFSPAGSTAFRASCNHISNTPNIFPYALNAVRDGSKLTMDYCGYINVNGTNVYKSTISEIYGIL